LRVVSLIQSQTPVPRKLISPSVKTYLMRVLHAITLCMIGDLVVLLEPMHCSRPVSERRRRNGTSESERNFSRERATIHRLQASRRERNL